MPAAPAPAARARRAVPWGVVALVAALAVFAAGVVWLFALRFDVGDVYPPYSTLRSDPLGAKAFFASLDSLPGLRAERSLQLLASLGIPPLSPAGDDHGENTFTCFCLGVDANEWPYLFDPDAVARLEAIMERGGRVVVTFQPTRTVPSTESLSNARSKHEGGGKVELHQGPAARRLAQRAARPDLIARWGLDFRRQRVHAASGGTDNALAPAGDSARPATPDPVSAAGQETAAWRSALDFRLDTVPAALLRWHPLYERRGRPVIVSRSVGTAGGGLVLVGDTYFLSNEGLRNDPAPALLAALVGGGRRVFFDESHLGLNEQPGLVTLARRYRLQGALLTLGLLAGLFVWRNVVSLVPPRAVADGEPDGAEIVAGHAAGRGYLNLLRRSVPPRDLPATCLAQWEQTPHPAGTLERVRAAFAAEAGQPARRRKSAAAVYRAMCAAARQKT